MLSGKQVFLVIILVIVVAGIVVDILYRRRRNRLQRIGTRVSALVMEVKIERITRASTEDRNWADSADRFENQRKYTYTFLYSVNGSEFVREFSYESWEQRYMQGETVDIYCNPDNPKEMMTAEEVESGASSGIGKTMPIFAVIIAIILYFLFTS